MATIETQSGGDRKCNRKKLPDYKEESSDPIGQFFSGNARSTLDIRKLLNLAGVSVAIHSGFPWNEMSA